MSLSVLSAIDSPVNRQADAVPWWGAWSACLIVGCFYLSQALGMMATDYMVSIGVGVVESATGDQSEIIAQHSRSWLAPFSLFIGTVFGAVIALNVATRRAQSTLESDWLLPFIGKPCDLRDLWRYVLLGLGLGLGFFLLTEYGVLPSDDLPSPLLDTLLAAPFLLQIGWAFMFVMLFPVIEEVLFRGVLFTGFSQSWGLGLAGAFTTVAFVGVHMPKVLEYWPALLAVTVVGALTVLIRIRTGSLAPGMALHCTYNGTLVAAAFLIPPSA